MLLLGNANVELAILMTYAVNYKFVQEGIMVQIVQRCVIVAVGVHATWAVENVSVMTDILEENVTKSVWLVTLVISVFKNAVVKITHRVIT